MSVFNEASLENAIMQMLEGVGYTHLQGDEIHRTLDEVLLVDDIRAFLLAQYVEDGITPSEVDRIIATLKSSAPNSLYEENARIFRLMVDGFNFKRDDSTKPHLFVRMFDFEDVKANIFKVVNQVEIEERHLRRPDAIIYVNGLPVVVMEFKSAVKEDCTIADAYKQLTVRYSRDIPSLFRYNAFVVISDGANNKFGSLFAPYDFFYAWNKVEAADKPQDGLNSLSTMVNGLFRPDRLLAVIRNFIFFPDSSTKEEKIVCRYPQYFAATALFDNILEHMRPAGDGKGGTYFGATGCGKSYTMLYLARMLMRSTALGSPTIVMITDRTDLDDQLSEQVFLKAKKFVNDTNIVQVESRSKLGELLRGRESGGIFLTTIQKFSEEIGLLSDRTNIICISDEAHRSQTNLDKRTRITYTEDGKAEAIKSTYGFAQYLRAALPNATYVGFTGTPIDGTLKVFGKIVDAYTMIDAVNDGITKRIVYEGRAAKVLADNRKLEEIERYYEECANAGATEEQTDKSKREVASVMSILGDPDRLQAIAEDFIDHYENRIAEGATVKGKAMIVCASRKIAFDLYKRITALRPQWLERLDCAPEDTLTEKEANKVLPSERIKLVMTGNKDDDPELFELLKSTGEPKALADQFKEEKSNFKIVIVVDMWLTGFDVPCLDTMYIDKPIQRHNLIQAISRVNRNYPGKDKGLVVDYIGFKKAMNFALRLYGGENGEFGGDDDVPTEGIEEMIKVVKDEIEIVGNLFHGFDYRDFFCGIELKRLVCLNQSVEFILRDKKREQLFMQHTKRLRSAFSLCCGRDEITRDEREKIVFFSSVRAIIAKMTRGEAPDVEQMNARVRQLLAEALKSNGVEEVVKIIEDKQGDLDIFSPEHMERIKQIELPNIKLLMLEKLLRQQIANFQKVNKVKAVEFSDRLKKLLSTYNDRSDDAVFTQEVMTAVTDGITELIRELHEEHDSFKTAGIDYEEKAFFDILKSVSDTMKFNYPEEKMKELSKEIKKIILNNSKYADCFRRDDIKAAMGFEITVLLSKNGYPPVGKDYAAVYQKVIEQAENLKRNYSE